MKWLQSVGILKLPPFMPGENPMSLLVMILIGCCVLVMGFIMLWITPAPTSLPRVVKPTDSSIRRHGTNSSADQQRSRMDRPDTIDSREK